MYYYMGNQFSTNTKEERQEGELEGLEEQEEIDLSQPRTSYEIIDYIATYYILTADFVSLTRLQLSKEYCDNLVILTSDIIDRYFTDLEITYLAQRTKDGIVVNTKKKGKIKFFNKDALNKLDIKNALKKKRMCQAIAKFYIFNGFNKVSNLRCSFEGYTLIFSQNFDKMLNLAHFMFS